jgi:hydantoinase/carbamoylase family amidase
MINIKDISQKIGETLVATVGNLEVMPGAVNVIPGEVDMILELRDINEKNIEEAISKIISASKKIPNVKFKFKKIIEKPTVMMDEELINIIKDNCEKNDIEYKMMISGAGHDAKSFADKIPTAMIFVPSVNGKSHCPEEDTKFIDIEKGVKVLLDTVISLDK